MSEATYPKDLGSPLKDMAYRDEDKRVTSLLACLGALLAWMCDVDDEQKYGHHLTVVGAWLKGDPSVAACKSGLPESEFARGVRHALARGNVQSINESGVIKHVELWNEYNGECRAAFRFTEEKLGELFQLVLGEFEKANEHGPREASVKAKGLLATIKR